MKHEEGAVWVRTDPAADGTYVVTVEVGVADRVAVLDRDRATRYAATLLEAVQRAEYDGAVIRQLGDRVSLEAATLTVVSMREDRPPLDDAATAPLRFVPGVSSSRRVGFLTLEVDGTPVGQWELDAARGHAVHVLEAVVAADLDGAYRRELVGVIGLDDGTARAVVAELGQHRPGP